MPGGVLGAGGPRKQKQIGGVSGKGPCEHPACPQAPTVCSKAECFLTSRLRVSHAGRAVQGVGRAAWNNEPGAGGAHPPCALPRLGCAGWTLQGTAGLRALSGGSRFPPGAHAHHGEHRPPRSCRRTPMAAPWPHPAPVPLTAAPRLPPTPWCPLQSWGGPWGADGTGRGEVAELRRQMSPTALGRGCGMLLSGSGIQTPSARSGGGL